MQSQKPITLAHVSTFSGEHLCLRDPARARAGSATILHQRSHMSYRCHSWNQEKVCSQRFSHTLEQIQLLLVELLKK